ncbi:restriction endonuclease subunit S [Methylomonas koyamae]|uniref:restriction endonuclease subunit S n=1 Tax=Methylomonas koyamae TaxID=702114 RepID=UPI002872BFA3|nr:restriction endonuclease subunit S [Methylomonas koyamae]WNB75941.1 restriction endonuclease subunit S [Methylomonas koyamae]
MNLKPGWSKVKFGEVVKLSKARCADPLAEGVERFVGLEHLEPGDLRIRRWGNVADGVTFTSLFKPGQVLFGKRRAYQRKVAVADFSGVCSGDIYVLESRDADVLLPDLLPFICQTDAFFEHAVGTSAGSLSPRTNWSSLANFEFALPPLNDQRRIIEILSSLESLRVELSVAIETAWVLRLSVYRNLMFHDQPAKAPPHWARSTIGESMLIKNSLRKPISADIRAQMQGEYPYYGPTGKIDSINEFRLDGTFILIGEDGDHFLKYKTWSMTQKIVGQANVNNHAHVIQGTDECSSGWFFHFYRHKDVREFLTKQGAGRLKLKKADLERMPILVPPREEQDQIVACIEECVGGTDSIIRRQDEISVLLRSTREQLIGELNV